MMNADVTVAGQSGASRGVTSKQTFRMGDHHTSANIIPPAFCNQDPVNTHIYMQGQCGASRAKYYKCLHLLAGTEFEVIHKI